MNKIVLYHTAVHADLLFSSDAGRNCGTQDESTPINNETGLITDCYMKRTCKIYVVLNT